MFCQLPAAFVGGKCQRCSGYYKVGTVVFFCVCEIMHVLFHFNFNFAICNSRFWLLLKQWTVKFCDDNLNQILQKYGPPKTCDQCKQKSAFDRGVNILILFSLLSNQKYVEIFPVAYNFLPTGQQPQADVLGLQSKLQTRPGQNQALRSC